MHKKQLVLFWVLVGLVLGFGAWKMVQANLDLAQVMTNPAAETTSTPESEVEYLSRKYGDFAVMTIPYLRSREYPGSEIVVDKTISTTESFSSYIASYQSDGLRINGLLTKPNGPEPEGGFPAVVFLHGYIQPDVYRTTEKYVEYVNYLARNGLVVFKIDLRGHADSEGEASGAYYSSDYVIDTLNAISSLARLGYVNPEKIGLWGHSMSGNTVLRTMAVKPDIKAAVIWAGAVYSYTDLAKYRINDTSFDRHHVTASKLVRRSQNLFETVGQVSEESEFWQKVAATNYLSDLTGSIQLHHAGDDMVVNPGYSKDLAEMLKTAGIDYDLEIYASGGHNLNSPAFATAMARTTEFYREKLF